jgi:hypothetical protein
MLLESSLGLHTKSATSTTTLLSGEDSLGLHTKSATSTTTLLSGEDLSQSDRGTAMLHMSAGDDFVCGLSFSPARSTSSGCRKGGDGRGTHRLE